MKVVNSRFVGYLYGTDSLRERRFLDNVKEVAEFLLEEENRPYLRIVTDGLLELKVLEIGRGQEITKENLDACFGDGVKAKDRKLISEIILAESKKERTCKESDYDCFDEEEEEEFLL